VGGVDGLPSQNVPAALLESSSESGAARCPRLLPRSLTDLATIGRDKTRVMRTIVGIFILAQITIAGEIYSDAALRSGSSIAAPDTAAATIAHGLKRG